MEHAILTFTLSVGAFLGITLGLLLLTVKSSKSRANIFLGVYLIALSSICVTGAAYRLGVLEQVPHLVHLHFFYTFACGPLTYFYVRACTEKNFTMKPILWLHFLPVVLGMAYQFPFYLQSGAEKYAHYVAFVENQETGMPPFIQILKAVWVFTYFGISVFLILNYKKHLNNEASVIDNAYARWLTFFSSVSLLPVVIIFVWTYIDTEEPPNNIAVVSIFLVNFLIYTFAFVKPSLFHAFPNQISEEEKEEQKEKYGNSNLQDAQKDRIVEKLLTYMETEKPYRTSDLTLSALSEQVDTPSYYLSQVINERMNGSFLDFINGYRIKSAQEMLTDKKFANLTIMAIAYDAGFNSKSAFYTAFKKNTGMTPSAYRKERNTTTLSPKHNTQNGYRT